MALTTRTVSWVVDTPNLQTAYGSIQIKPSVPVIVDTVGGVTYVQATLTYPLSAGVSDPIITTDNAGTNPASGSWGYDVLVQLAPGVPDISVQNVPIPSGGGSYSLASILNAAGL